MSEPPTSPGDLASRLPSWARPREREQIGAGSLRLAESAIVILVGLLLALATIHDVVLQTRVNHRLVSDLATWRAATGRHYHNLVVEQDIKRRTTNETVCGNVSPGGPDERTQLCLLISGKVIAGHRSVGGGYYLPPKTLDERANRYACFGRAKGLGLCGRAGSPPALAIRLGRP